MNMRKITSMTMVWSFIILILNSVVLYVVPEGRVAYWADWRFLGLTKGDWGQQHTTVGFLFLFAGVLHIYYNWNPIMAYMKNKTKQFRLFSMPSTVGLLLTVIFVVGTYFSIAPMSTIINISEHFKDQASQKYGEPPYGHAESSSLQMFAKRENLDLEKSIELLTSGGVQVDGPKTTIKELAAKHNLSPQQIYTMIKPASMNVEVPADAGGAVPFPDAPKPGWGKTQLAEVCVQYGLDLDVILAELGKRNITATGEDSIKDIAAANGMEPMGLFELLQEIVNSR